MNQLIDDARSEGYSLGRKTEQEIGQRTHSIQATQMTREKIEALHAATKLIEESGRMMSRAGYMVGKILGDNSR